MTDKEAFLRILSMVLDKFPADRGYDPQWVFNTTKTYFEIYKNTFIDEENIPSSNEKIAPK